VVFMPQPASAAALKKLQDFTIVPDRVSYRDKEMYFYFPNGVSASSLWKHPLDRVLAAPTTMRNWKTVNKLHEIAREVE
jgi:uncharacterized protein (DUF1697 family)